MPFSRQVSFEMIRYIISFTQTPSMLDVSATFAPRRQASASSTQASRDTGTSSMSHDTCPERGHLQNGNQPPQTGEPNQPSNNRHEDRFPSRLDALFSSGQHPIFGPFSLTSDPVQDTTTGIDRSHRSSAELSPRATDHTLHPYRLSSPEYVTAGPITPAAAAMLSQTQPLTLYDYPPTFTSIRNPNPNISINTNSTTVRTANLNDLQRFRRASLSSLSSLSSICSLSSTASANASANANANIAAQLTSLLTPTNPIDAAAATSATHRHDPSPPPAALQQTLLALLDNICTEALRRSWNAETERRLVRHLEARRTHPRRGGGAGRWSPYAARGAGHEAGTAPERRVPGSPRRRVVAAAAAAAAGIGPGPGPGPGNGYSHAPGPPPDRGGLGAGLASGCDIMTYVRLVASATWENACRRGRMAALAPLDPHPHPHLHPHPHPHPPHGAETRALGQMQNLYGFGIYVTRAGEAARSGRLLAAEEVRAVIAAARGLCAVLGYEDGVGRVEEVGREWGSGGY